MGTLLSTFRSLPWPSFQQPYGRAELWILLIRREQTLVRPLVRDRMRAVVPEKLPEAHKYELGTATQDKLVALYGAGLPNLTEKSSI